jgi:hypothetical protein
VDFSRKPPGDCAAAGMARRAMARRAIRRKKDTRVLLAMTRLL